MALRDPVQEQVISKFIQRLLSSVSRSAVLKAFPTRTVKRIDLARFHIAHPEAPGKLVQALVQPEGRYRLVFQDYRRTDDRGSQSQALFTTLRTKLAREAQAVHRDTGIWMLWLAYPILFVPHPSPDHEEFLLAPLFLWPIRIDSANLPEGELILKREQGAPRFNRIAWQWIRRNLEFDAREPTTPELLQMADFNALREIVKRCCDGFRPVLDISLQPSIQPVPERGSLKGLERPRLLDAGIVGLIQWENMELLADLEKLYGLDVLLGPAGDFLRERERPPASAIEIPEEKNRFLVTDTDHFQERAVWMARRPEGVVIHGPPGTGKSQVIVNIVADALARNERVLVVCQKKAALDVVSSRLRAVGLGDLSIQVDDAEGDRRRIIELLRDQESPSQFVNEQERIEAAAEIERLEKQFEEYSRALFRARELRRINYRTMLARISRLEREWPGVRPLEALREFFKEINETDLNRLSEALARLEDLFWAANVPENPWVCGKENLSGDRYEIEEINADLERTLPPANTADSWTGKKGPSCGKLVGTTKEISDAASRLAMTWPRLNLRFARKLGHGQKIVAEIEANQYIKAADAVESIFKKQHSLSRHFSPSFYGNKKTIKVFIALRKWAIASTAHSVYGAIASRAADVSRCEPLLKAVGRWLEASKASRLLEDITIAKPIARGRGSEKSDSTPLIPAAFNSGTTPSLPHGAIIMAQPTSDRDALAIDYSRCPLPQTHRRLIESHLLWHQTLDQYQQPELFQANLNATIQALRNITFILQSEKHSFKQFENWYGPWQQRMRADPVLIWLKDARNSVVKQGDLETTSTAIVRLVTWRDVVLMESAIPPGAPSSLIIRNLPLLELVNNTHLPPSDLKSAAIVIERRWSAPGLNGREILEALAQAYGLLSDIVLDAHIALGKTDCVLSSGTHVHFRSAYHTSGTLPCMSLGVERRTHSFDLATGLQFKTGWTVAPTADPKIAAKRYGLGETDQIPIWQTGDPLLLADRVLYTAKRILRKDRALIRILFIRDGGGSWHPISLVASNRTEKNLLMRLVARFVESVGGDAIIDVSEVWMLQLKDTLPNTFINDIQYAPGRGEAVSVLVATRDGFLRGYTTPFTRGPLGGIKLGDTVQLEGDYPYYLKPVFDVWRTQGTTYSPNGKRVRRLWEPDPLDTCFCGGPQRFGECCKRLLDTLDRRAEIKQDIDKAITVHDFARFEELARAELAQYVIWVRQHTNPTRHVAPELHRKWVEVDMPALSVLILRLADALETNGRSDSFLPQLRQISRVIGVPELSIRITSLAVQWLFEIGDYSSALKEMKTLGDLERLGDTLALVLATKLRDLPNHKREQFLTRAVSGALWEEERWLAELELARHLSDCGRQAEAVRKVDSVIAELMEMSGHRSLRAGAMSLRWYITKEKNDFQAAKNELGALPGPEHQQHLAVILIDHGDFDEAERILSGALMAGDPVAQLLIIDARLRANRSDSARELLLIITPDRVTPRLQHPYAVAYTLVALACADDGLKKAAAAKLRELPTIGTRVAIQVNDMLKALEGHENMERQSPTARFRGLFR